ncbi:MAG: hypothetical protein Q8Q17_01535 [bacterium]|nr:hypothetical protein [bacterium]
MKNSEQKLNNYIVIPREIRAMRLRGELSKAEFDVYVWTRLACSAYGIVQTSLEDIMNDALSGCTKNYANKILLGLRSKKLVWYEERQGRRGSFEIHHGDFLTLDGQIKTLDKYFGTGIVRSESKSDIPNRSEVSAEVSAKIQKFDNSESEEKSMQSFGDITELFRSIDNDRYKEKDKDKIDNRASSLKGIPVEEFKPKDNDESRCLEIAQALGENDMRFILSALRRCGLSKVEGAWGLVREGKNINNPRKYFNSVINTFECFRVVD